MLFNSYLFICLFLPIVVSGFFLLGRKSNYWAAIWLNVASLVFYAAWSPAYVFLLIASILFNYGCGVQIARAYSRGGVRTVKWLLILGCTVDLSLLAYYKYMVFFAEAANEFLGQHFEKLEIILPIGISFYTFTQIAFLVDASKGLAREYKLRNYFTFVTYFPHLIAGPVLHHKEMMPQFERKETYIFSYHSVAVGLTLFVFGLAKKTLLADNLSVYVGPVFDAAARDGQVAFLEAWGGILSYTLQIYFDFSGYSDMAVGLSKIFGVDLPINFFSPYKSKNITQFWRSWHMTLSRFLRDYLYIPLGGNRSGRARRYINIFITMLLGGFWHGANWTYLAWGGLHGFYIISNNLWKSALEHYGVDCGASRIYSIVSRSVTYFAIVFAWVFFRSESVSASLSIIKGMLGFNGFAIPIKWLNYENPIISWLLKEGAYVSELDLFQVGPELRMIAAGLLISWALPNTNEVFLGYGVYGDRWWRWKPNALWLVFTIVLALFSFLSLSGVSEFIYFQF